MKNQQEEQRKRDFLHKEKLNRIKQINKVLCCISLTSILLSCTLADPPLTTVLHNVVKNISATTVDSARVKIYHKKNKIWLRGTVTSHEDKQILEQAARNTPGVLEVVNKLKVDAPLLLDTPQQDTELEEIISQAMKKLPRKETELVTYVIDGGIVTLSGWVKSKKHIDDIVAHLLAVPGIQGVRSLLQVKSA